MDIRPLRNALISVFYKDGLEPILRRLHEEGVALYSTGGTRTFIESLGMPVFAVEDLTSYPSILDGRVKTLHPKVFGGILARREPGHLAELAQWDIPEMDLVMVDLYPFEETIRQTTDEGAIIEKIDIGGVSLIRAAAKNYRDVTIIPAREAWSEFLHLLEIQGARTTLQDRRRFADMAFRVTAGYDLAISQWFGGAGLPEDQFRVQAGPGRPLRYGENPHQQGRYFGPLEQVVRQLHGKELSYNNLLDLEAALLLISEFREEDPTTVIIKHTNACGVATRPTLAASWAAALAGDPVSAFGGIIAMNRPVDVEVARSVDEIFYEVMLAPAFRQEALEILRARKNRIIATFPSDWQPAPHQFRSLLGGVLVQDYDAVRETGADLRVVTRRAPSAEEVADLCFANTCVKHLKSNGIALVRDRQLLGMGCGQTSRVDALRQAIAKARHFGFDLQGAVMASDAFFPFPDCVEIAHEAGIRAVIHPGGSIKDQESIDFCDAHDQAMVLTGNRHFRHG